MYVFCVVSDFDDEFCIFSRDPKDNKCHYLFQVNITTDIIPIIIIFCRSKRFRKKIWTKRTFYLI